jgi:peptidoglycan/LPS O-acetylase OafA/YrhL
VSEAEEQGFVEKFDAHLAIEVFTEAVQHRSAGFDEVPVYVVMGAVVTLLAVPVAYASMKGVEQPFIRLGRHLTPVTVPAIEAKV